MTSTLAARIAAALGALAVGLGAFGAHGLKTTLAELGTTALWEKAVFYHFIHAVMLWVVARLEPLRRGPWFCFLAGIILFSGSLYWLALTNARWLGAVTPFGGTAFVIGWLWLALGPSRNATAPRS
ncbi:MAG: DUF423 domain-containing protein [Verrucomicrobiae bacterium]|nr:DUF423 domain-containing protein [Verrucomicrobiae bacterium]MDW8309583.1 DUF423 domain-containing protein [Verrucomicrobiales bacterium]